MVLAQSTVAAFILGSVAGFTSILLGRLTNVLDRIRSLNEIADDDTARAHLKSDIPRLRQRAILLNGETHLALISGMTCRDSGFASGSHSCRTPTYAVTNPATKSNAVHMSGHRERITAVV